MPNGIHESLKNLSVEVNTLSPLDGNPRIGDVDAIMASYKEFGQLKPIVAKKNDDGTATVIAGNHQLAAAIQLGWDKIAVVFIEADDKRAIAYAIADNRTMELGYTEPELLENMLNEISDYYPELLDGLGWDEFDMAEIEQSSLREGSELSTSGVYSTPVMVDQKPKFDDPVRLHVEEDEGGDRKIVASPGMDHNDIAIRGSTINSPSPQAVVQYTLVFDNTDQQAIWYDFIRWLRNDPAIVGSTTAERLVDFIQARTEV
jgi:hypothetical protein